jgi:hypothetical protein
VALGDCFGEGELTAEGFADSARRAGCVDVTIKYATAASNPTTAMMRDGEIFKRT